MWRALESAGYSTSAPLYTEEVLLAPAEQGWEYQEEAASLYTEDDHWQGSQTVVVQDRDGASSQIRLLYDFPR